MERTAMEVERGTVDVYRAWVMRDRVGDTFEGTVSSCTPSGAYVTLDAPFVDVFLRIEALGSDTYACDDEGLAIVGVRSGDRITMGDRLLVRVDDVSLVRRQVLGARLETLQRAHGNDDGALEAYRRRRAKRENEGTAKRLDARRERAGGAEKPTRGSSGRTRTGERPAPGGKAAKPTVGPKASKALKKASKKLKRR
jgi:ribonuclease R